MKSAVGLPVRVPWKFAECQRQVELETGRMNSYPHFNVWLPTLKVIVSLNCQLV